jgi:hypothetical protein
VRTTLDIPQNLMLEPQRLLGLIEKQNRDCVPPRLDSPLVELTSSSFTGRRRFDTDLLESRRRPKKMLVRGDGN